MNNSELPLSNKNITRWLLFCFIIALFFAGYYHTLLQLEQKKYNRLEDKYVRVRNQLGTLEMQRLIDESYITPPQTKDKSNTD